MGPTARSLAAVFILAATLCARPADAALCSDVPASPSPLIQCNAGLFGVSFPPGGVCSCYCPGGSNPNVAKGQFTSAASCTAAWCATQAGCVGLSNGTTAEGVTQSYVSNSAFADAMSAAMTTPNGYGCTSWDAQCPPSGSATPVSSCASHLAGWALRTFSAVPGAAFCNIVNSTARSTPPATAGAPGSGNFAVCVGTSLCNAKPAGSTAQAGAGPTPAAASPPPPSPAPVVGGLPPVVVASPPPPVNSSTPSPTPPPKSGAQQQRAGVVGVLAAVAVAVMAMAGSAC